MAALSASLRLSFFPISAKIKVCIKADYPVVNLPDFLARNDRIYK